MFGLLEISRGLKVIHAEPLSLVLQPLALSSALRLVMPSADRWEAGTHMIERYVEAWSRRLRWLRVLCKVKHPLLADMPEKISEGVAGVRKVDLEEIGWMCYDRDHTVLDLLASCDSLLTSTDNCSHRRETSVYLLCVLYMY